MTRSRVSLVVPFLALSLLPVSLSAQTSPPIRAIIVHDINTRQHAAISAKMSKLGWDYDSVGALELINADSAALAEYDLIWVPATTSYSALRLMMKPGGALHDYTLAGGYLVIMGANPGGAWLDLGPGGTDAFDFTGDGTVTVASPSHPMVSGAGTGGVQLTPEQFDPFITGGRASFANIPAGSEVVVSNEAGPVVIEYSHGDGQVWLAATDREHTSCADNLLLYLQAHVQ